MTPGYGLWTLSQVMAVLEHEATGIRLRLAGLLIRVTDTVCVP